MTGDLPETVQTEACRALYDEWRVWRGGNPLPVRRDVRLEALKRCLPNMLVLELRSQTEAIFRLFGTRLVEHLGFDPTGMNYIDLAPPSDRQRRMERLWNQATQPCGSHFIIPHPYADGAVSPTECLALPVRGDADDGHIQLFSVSDHMQDLPRLWRPSDGPQNMPVADLFRYVDVGAGVPEDGDVDIALKSAAS